VILKRQRELDIMAQAGDINRSALDTVAEAIAPGVSTAELDAIAEDAIVAGGGMPANKGYRGFPYTLCTSVNDVVVHGFPSHQVLEDGDIISVDIGTIYQGYVADMAYTYPVGQVGSSARRLLEVTETSLQAGIEAAQVGNRLGDISAAIQTVVEAAGLWVVREFVGHGIGHEYHEPPELPNFGQIGTGPRLRPGLVLAIEPMVTERRTGVRILDDNWTAPTTDGSLAAHFEHTVAITEGGPWVLTAPEVPQLIFAEGGSHGA
jgi:methionyl aminopeptidase